MLEEPTGSELDYLRLLRRIAGRWKLIVAVFFAVVLPVTVWALRRSSSQFSAAALSPKPS